MSDKWKQVHLEKEPYLFGDEWKSVWEDDKGRRVTGRGSTPEEAEKEAKRKIANGEYDSEWCLVTTACVRWAGLPDDCRELTLIRRLRDEHVRHLREGEAILEAYARLAPPLIRRIEAAEDADAVWARLLAVIRRTAELVEAGRLSEALRIGWSEFRRLCQERLGVDPGPAPSA